MYDARIAFDFYDQDYIGLDMANNNMDVVLRVLKLCGSASPLARNATPHQRRAVIAPTFLLSVLRRILNVTYLPTRLQLSHFILLLPYCQPIDNVAVEPLDQEGLWLFTACTWLIDAAVAGKDERALYVMANFGDIFMTADQRRIRSVESAYTSRMVHHSSVPTPANALVQNTTSSKLMAAAQFKQDREAMLQLRSTIKTSSARLMVARSASATGRDDAEHRERSRAHGWDSGDEDVSGDGVLDDGDLDTDHSDTDDDVLQPPPASAPPSRRASSARPVLSTTQPSPSRATQPSPSRATQPRPQSSGAPAKPAVHASVDGLPSPRFSTRPPASAPLMRASSTVHRSTMSSKASHGPALSSAGRMRSTQAYQHRPEIAQHRAEAHRIAATVLSFDKDEFASDITRDAASASSSALSVADYDDALRMGRRGQPLVDTSARRTMAAELARLGLGTDSIRVIRRHTDSAHARHQQLRDEIRQEMGAHMARVTATHSVVTVRPLIVSKDDVAFQHRLIADMSYITEMQ